MPSCSEQYFESLSYQHLSNGSVPEQRLVAWQEIVADTETQMQQLNSSNVHVACGPGCGSCCAINVNILEPEALAICRFVEDHFSPDERQKLQQRLSKLHCETRWLDDEERMMSRKACALLDEQQNCSIHPVRPLLCRGLTSTDPLKCRDAIAMLALGEAPQVMCYLAQKNLYDVAYLGFSAALGKLGLDDRNHRLTGLLLEQLNT